MTAGVILGLLAAIQAPATDWKIDVDHAFPAGKPTPLVRALLGEIGAKSNANGSSVSASDFRKLLADPRAAEVYPDILLKIATPASRNIQHAEHVSFLDLFMKEPKLAAGAAFLREHDAELKAAHATYGVAAKDIASILMWESGLGASTGTYRVVNVYLSQILYLDDAFAQAEKTGPLPEGFDRAAHLARLERKKKQAVSFLAALLRSCAQKGQDPLDIRGSWAGAIGFPQFMPTSFRFAADGDGDGKIDLYAFPDAIASIAKYLAAHGYKADRAKAIDGYNHESAYVSGVMAYADAIAAR